MKSHMAHNRSAAPTPDASRSVTPAPLNHLQMNGNSTLGVQPLTGLSPSAVQNSDRPLGSCIKS